MDVCAAGNFTLSEEERRTKRRVYLANMEKSFSAVENRGFLVALKICGS